MAAETLKAMLTTWREDGNRCRAESSRLVSETVAAYNRGCADAIELRVEELETALALCESPAAETPLVLTDEDYELMNAPMGPVAETWQPIATAPKDGTRILLALGGAILNEEIVIGYWDAYYAQGGRGYTGNAGWVDASSSDEVNPTLWRSLPAPPTSGAAQETKS